MGWYVQKLARSRPDASLNRRIRAEKISSLAMCLGLLWQKGSIWYDYSWCITALNMSRIQVSLGSISVVRCLRAFDKLDGFRAQTVKSLAMARQTIKQHLQTNFQRDYLGYNTNRMDTFHTSNCLMWTSSNNLPVSFSVLEGHRE